MIVLALLACRGDDKDTVTGTVPPPVPTTPAPTACPDGLPFADFDASAPTGIRRGELAADFTLETRDGTFTLSDGWNGCDDYGFLPDVDLSTSPTWPTLFERDVKELLDASPADMHWFFFETQDGQLDALEKDLDRILGNNEERAAKWAGRLHLVDELKGWPADKFATTGYGFLVGRDRRIRDVGSLANPDRYDQAIGWFENDVSYAANEAIYADFELARERDLAATGDRVVPLFSQDVTGSAEVTLTEDLSAADAVSLDLSLGCPGDVEFGNCPAWDYLIYLHECGRPDEPDDAHAAEACQPYVAPVTPSAEVMGSCHLAGVDQGLPCRDVAECADPGATCDGYAPEVTEVVEVPADTLACTCAGADDQPEEHVRTCVADGSGYGGCPCDCEELGRWVTPYHREGRWVSDVTPLSYFLADPGPDRLVFSTGQTYKVDLSLRVGDREGLGPPDELHWLWSGGAFDNDYNTGREPVVIDIPADAKKVELVAVISGHGFGANADNCAEFCNHTHHFFVNGAEHVKEHPEAHDDLGCVAQVAEGTTPNQFGTWFYGRGGWCPGLDIPPWIVDVTGDVTPGQPTTITYEGRLDGEPYVERPASGDFGARIDMVSWLAIWR